MATSLLLAVSALLLVCVPTTAFVRRRFHTEEDDFVDLQRKEAKLVRSLPTKLAEYDINGDGELEYDEFAQIVKEFNAVAKFDPEGLAQAYSDADVNDNGKLEDDELAVLLSEVDAVLSDENSQPADRAMMRTTVRRLNTLRSHLVNATVGLHTSPNLVITPKTSLIDQKVHIRLKGLEPNQMIRLVAKVRENNINFQSNCLLRASDGGEIDLNNDASLGGTYTGKDPMGLFWSLEPCSGQGQGIRLVKKDVTSPMEITIQAIRESSKNQTGSTADVLAEDKLERFYMKPGVKRIPVKEGKFRGTVFIPEGPGPFPGLTDMFGGIVSLIETRAALLASHGYATFAISYLYTDHLPQNLMGADEEYIQAAAEWFFSQPYIDRSKVGAVGLCFGGCLSLMLAARIPLIKAVVNINGITIVPTDSWKVHTKCDQGLQWPRPEQVYRTSEGVVIDHVYECDNPTPLPAWQHGAKVLIIVGEDDKQVHPKWHFFYQDHWPAALKDRLELHAYVGAGHLIEPPYSPHCRSVRPSKERIASVDFIGPEYQDLPFMMGGYPVQHAHAQEDSWKRILDFLKRELGT